MVLEYSIRNKIFFSPWTPIRTKEYYTLNKQINQLVEKVEYFKNEKELRFYILKKDDLNLIIGDFGFTNIIKGAFLSCHLGYKMDSNEINKGYMEEALKKGIDYLFKEKKLHRIESNIMPRNKPSIRLMEKLGFINEGLSKKYLQINGRWEDHFHFVLFNEEIEE